MPNSTKPLCKYGKDCYQKNKNHIEKYEHPENNEIGDNTSKRAISPVKNNRETKRVKQCSRLDESSPPKKNNYNLRSPRTSTESSANESADITTPPKQNKVTRLLPNKIANSSNLCKNGEGPTPEEDIDFINDVFDKETMFSQRAEYKEMLKDSQVFIKNKFLVEMPQDFYAFWNYCKDNVKNDIKPENIFSKFGLTLCGPFDVLAGKFDNAAMFEPGDYLRHCRYYYDPPEFQVKSILIYS